MQAYNTPPGDPEQQAGRPISLKPGMGSPLQGMQLDFGQTPSPSSYHPPADKRFEHDDAVYSALPFLHGGKPRYLLRTYSAPAVTRPLTDCPPSLPSHNTRYDYDMESAMEIDSMLCTPPSGPPAEFFHASTSGDLADIGLARREESPCDFGDTPSPNAIPSNNISPSDRMQS